MKTAHLIIRLILAVAGLCFAAGAMAAENPRTGVSLSVALHDANQLAAQNPALRVLRVEGDSMLPFFGSGAVLVVKPMPASSLHVGMVVVYTNRFNETVAHRVVARTAAGLEVRGYNNERADSTVVTDANLIGVVYVTLHSNSRVDAPMLAAVNGGPQVALAASAR